VGDGAVSLGTICACKQGVTVMRKHLVAGDLVGFYTDAAGNTDGMLATP
jgi:hypothetical protein